MANYFVSSSLKIIHQYKFEDDTDNTNVTDTFGLTGVSARNSSLRSVTGRIGKAFDFNGDNDLVTLAKETNDLLFDTATSAFALSIWYKKPPGDAGYIIGRWGGAGDRAYFSGFDSNNKFVFSMSEDGTAQSTFTTTGAVPEDTSWHHLVVNIDIGAGSGSVYVDGSAVATGSFPSITDINDNGTDIVFGASGIGAAGDFVGELDDFRIYDCCLSAHQVSLLYNGGEGTQKLVIQPECTTVAGALANMETYLETKDSTDNPIYFIKAINRGGKNQWSHAIINKS